jgi:hypothetical protein
VLLPYCPNNTHTVERYVRFVNPRAAASSVLRKIVIEFAQHQLAGEYGGVPREWRDKYDEKSFHVRQELTKELEVEGEETHPEIKEMFLDLERKSINGVTMEEVFDALRAEGFQFTQDVGRRIIRKHRELQSKKFGILLDLPEVQEQLKTYKFAPPELSKEEEREWTNLLSRNSKRIQS